MRCEPNHQVEEEFDFASGLADGLKENSTLTSLDISRNGLRAEDGMILAGALKRNKVMKRFHIAGNRLDTTYERSEFDVSMQSIRRTTSTSEDAISSLIDSFHTMQALSSVNILANGLGVQEANKLVKLIEPGKPLMTLCGLDADTTKLDLTGNEAKPRRIGGEEDPRLGPGCVVLLAKEIATHAALEELVLSRNGIMTKEAGEALGNMLKTTRALTVLDISDCAKYTDKPDAAGFVEALCVGLAENAKARLLCRDGSGQFEGKKKLLKQTPECKHCGKPRDEHIVPVRVSLVLSCRRSSLIA